MSMKAPTLTEIAARIDAHLKRIEADPVLNPRHVGPFPYVWVNSRARRYSNTVGIVYMANLYPHPQSLGRDEALQYLAWLDAGNVGTHKDMRKAAAVPA